METIIGLMSALEHSALGQLARGSTWLYPLANLTHVLGAALLVGGIATFDIQVLRRAPEANAVARAAIPIAAMGLLLQVLSGVVLVSAEASTMVVNRAYQFKMALILLGLINVALFHWRFGAALRANAPLDAAVPHAAVSLVGWVLVLLAGRTIAYV